MEMIAARCGSWNDREIAEPLAQGDAHDAEHQLRHGEHDDDEGAEAECRAVCGGSRPKLTAQTACRCRPRTSATGATRDRHRHQRQQRQRVLAEHAAAAHRQGVGFVFELPRGADGADQRVPARNRTTGDGDEQHRPDRLDGRAHWMMMPRSLTCVVDPAANILPGRSPPSSARIAGHAADAAHDARARTGR